MNKISYFFSKLSWFSGGFWIFWGFFWVPQPIHWFHKFLNIHHSHLFYSSSPFYYLTSHIHAIWKPQTANKQTPHNQNSQERANLQNPIQKPWYYQKSVNYQKRVLFLIEHENRHDKNFGSNFFWRRWHPKSHKPLWIRQIPFTNILYINSIS